MYKPSLSHVVGVFASSSAMAALATASVAHAVARAAFAASPSFALAAIADAWASKLAAVVNSATGWVRTGVVVPACTVRTEINTVPYGTVRYNIGGKQNR